MKKKIILLLVLLIAASTGGYFYLHQPNKHNDNNITLYGNVDIREAQLAFNSSEHVNELFVQEGDHVKKGQLLATLHTQLLDAQLLQIQAQLESSQQTLAKLKAGYRIEDINKAKAEYSAAKAETKAALDTYKRLKPLLKKKLVSPEQLENAQAAADIAKVLISMQN
jgi:HlyD family secretion protein